MNEFFVINRHYSAVRNELWEWDNRKDLREHVTCGEGC